MNKSMIKLVGIGKWVLALVMIFAIMSHGKTDNLSETSFEDMSAQVIAAADLEAMQPADTQMIRRLYGLDGSAFDGITLYYPKTNMGAEELLLVKMKDPSQAEGLRAVIDKRLETQIKSFEGYGAEQTAMLKNSVVEIRGNYALFCSAANPAPVLEAFSKAY